MNEDKLRETVNVEKNTKGEQKWKLKILLNFCTWESPATTSTNETNRERAQLGRS